MGTKGIGVEEFPWEMEESSGWKRIEGLFGNWWNEWE
jgi:hypothetical protein